MASSRKPGCFVADVTAYRGPYQSRGTLPLGEWYVFANGRIYMLDITDVSGSIVTATFSSGDIANATWNAPRLEFTRVVRTSSTSELRQQFSGYLSAWDDNDPKWRMAGVFGDVRDIPQAGWYATLPRE